MSFVSDKALIKTALEAIGYKELPSNLDIVNEMPASFVDKGFTLKPLGLNTKFQISQAQLNEVRAELIIAYKGMSNTDYDTNFDLFNTALTAIKTLHSGYEDKPEYKRYDKSTFNTYGRVIITLGVEQC